MNCERDGEFLCDTLSDVESLERCQEDAALDSAGLVVVPMSAHRKD